MKYEQSFNDKMMISIGKISSLLMIIIVMLYCPGEAKCPSRNEVQPLDLNQVLAEEQFTWKSVHNFCIDGLNSFMVVKLKREILKLMGFSKYLDDLKDVMALRRINEDILSVHCEKKMKFPGNWYMVAGTPVSGKSLSKCGHFAVKPTSDDTFTMNYTAVSRRDHHPVAFRVDARVDDDITGNWQLQGSTRILGPFKHRIVSVDYNSYIVFVVCGDTNQILRGREFSMIWSRTRSLPPAVLNELKDNLAQYVKKADILDVDHNEC